LGTVRVCRLKFVSMTYAQSARGATFPAASEFTGEIWRALGSMRRVRDLKKSFYRNLVWFHNY
jgi:hypothetical protein